MRLVTGSPLGRSPRNPVAWSAAVGALVLAVSTADAFAGDVTVTRQGKKVLVRGSGGDDEIQIAPGSASDTLLFSGANGSTVSGASSVELEVHPSDTVDIDLGAGFNTVRFQGQFPAFRTISCRGGPDIDVFIFNPCTFPGSVTVKDTAGGVALALLATHISGKLTMAAGAGDDTLQALGSQVDGKISVSLGEAAQSNQMYLDGFTAGSSVKVKGGNVSDSVEMTSTTVAKTLLFDAGGGDDSFRADELDVTGNSTIRLKDGADELVLFGSTFHSKLAVDLGTGNDTSDLRVVEAAKGLKFNSGTGNDQARFADLKSAGPVALIAGDGDDTLTFGDTLGSQSSKDLVADGGKGTDVLNGAPNVTGGGAFAPENFE